MKNTPEKSISTTLLGGFDPVVTCAWLPDRKIRLSEYQDMIDYFVQKYAKETSNAK